MPQLVHAIKDELPDRFFCHYQKELEHELASSFRMTPFGTHLKMDFHGFRSDLSLTGPQNCIQLTQRDEPQLRKFYQTAYPGNYFDPQMLTTGKYFGIKKDEEILSVAGVHVYSRNYRIATLGNVTTHPNMRNRGLAKRCVVTLLKTLKPEVDFIGLNTKADNYPAIALYHTIGFKIASTYEEALFEKHSN
jgi:GNAT superfamily N-acetyltransferase